ncbi:MAG: hypothetical protein HOP28_16720 [Gemmatimonadales bacterium]|nr:hypothetical protein [Gemmatimonadales bacterium]
MKLRSAFLALTLLVAGACGKGDGGTGPSDSATRLDITNSTNLSIWIVRIRNCGSSSWGSDLLGADVISPNLGQSFVVTPGCHDVRLESNPDADVAVEWLNISFPSGQITTRTLAAWQ